ncbi:hypothetical protein ACTQ34_17715, partial [Agathobaculum sp. LCP25S3_E8]|uniref:hypothetical protein n=1 Tax=Agathobaculum sp. LCP25S3_E8 TaxID=3438735 RepID=UPI003F8FA959
FSTSALYSALYFCPIFNTLSVLHYTTLGVRFYCITPEVETLAGGNIIARPHFAQVMLRRG